MKYLTPLLPIVLYLAAASTVLQAEVQVDLQFTTANFSKEEQELLQKASQRAFAALISAEVANCIYRESFRPFAVEPKGKKLYAAAVSKEELRQLWSSQVAYLNKFKKFSLAIAKETLPATELGRAKLAVAVADRANYELLNLSIVLDPSKIAVSRTRVAKDKSSADPLDMWVNVIAHEISHNLGYSHGTSGNWEDDYPGYVPTEAGFCTMSHGKFGSHLGDLQKQRVWEKKYAVKSKS
jgi:hypothetical protein